MSTIKAGRDIAPFGIRIPSDLKEKLQSFADKNGRSLNAEILYRLDQSVSQDGLDVIRENKEFFLEIINLLKDKQGNNKDKNKP